MINLMPKIKVSKNPRNPFDLFLVYLNFMINKFTYEKYQYHKRVVCKLCMTITDGTGHSHTKCDHSAKAIDSEVDANTEDFENYINGGHHYTGKMCARHRLPSNGSVSSFGYTNNVRRYRHTISYASNTDTMSQFNNSVRGSFSGAKKRLKIKKRNNEAKFDFKIETRTVNNKPNEMTVRPNTSLGLNKIEIDSIIRKQFGEDAVNRVRRLSDGRSRSNDLKRNNSSKNLNEIEQPRDAHATENSQSRSRKTSRSKVHFTIDSDDEPPKNSKQIREELSGGNLYLNFLNFLLSSMKLIMFCILEHSLYKINKSKSLFSVSNLTDDTKVVIHEIQQLPDLLKVEINSETPKKLELKVIDSDTKEMNMLLSPSDTQNSDSKLGWDTYWDKLESNVLGLAPD